MKVPIVDIHRAIKEGLRPKSYLQKVLDGSKGQGLDPQFGPYVDLDSDEFSDLRVDFYETRQVRLGDLMAKFTKKLHIPLCTGCSRRRKKMNRYAFRWTRGKPWTLEIVRIG